MRMCCTADVIRLLRCFLNCRLKRSMSMCIPPRRKCAFGMRTRFINVSFTHLRASVRAAAAAQPLAQYDLLFGQRPAPPAVEQANPVDGLEAEKRANLSSGAQT